MTKVKAIFLTTLIALTACEEKEIDKYLDRLEEITREEEVSKERAPLPQIETSDVVEMRNKMAGTFRVTQKLTPCPVRREFKDGGLFDTLTLKKLPKSLWSLYTDETRQKALYTKLSDTENLSEAFFFMSMEKQSMMFVKNTHPHEPDYEPFHIIVHDENSFEIEIRTCFQNRSVVFFYEKESVL